MSCTDIWCMYYFATPTHNSPVPHQPIKITYTQQRADLSSYFLLPPLLPQQLQFVMLSQTCNTANCLLMAQSLKSKFTSGLLLDRFLFEFACCLAYCLACCLACCLVYCLACCLSASRFLPVWDCNADQYA